MLLHLDNYKQLLCNNSSPIKTTGDNIYTGWISVMVLQTLRYPYWDCICTYISRGGRAHIVFLREVLSTRFKWKLMHVKYCLKRGCRGWYVLYVLYVAYVWTTLNKKYNLQKNVHNFDLVFEILMFKKSGRGLIHFYFIYVFQLNTTKSAK
jgi:hypothetical protein